MNLKLYTAAQNSAGERVRVALLLKGLNFEYVPVWHTKSEDYVRRNPQALMPTLEVNGSFITQSLAIIEFMNEQFPDPPLFPEDPLLRAQTRSFALAISAELHALTVKRVRKLLLAEMEVGIPKIDAWYAHWTQTTLAALEAILAMRHVAYDFCFADHPTLADITLVPQLANARRFHCDLSKFPMLQQVENRCKDLPAFENARPENQIDYQL